MNKKNLISISAYVFLVLLLWFFTVPEFSGFLKIRQEIVLKKKAIELEKQVINKLNSINQVLDSQKGNVERLGQAIPNSESKPELLSIMENLASQNGLSLNSINIEPKSDSSSRSNIRVGDLVANGVSIKALKVDVQMSGAYSSFKTWLEDIEKNLRITDVVKITFGISDRKNETGEIIPNIDPIIDYGVTIDTYVLNK